MKMGPITRKSTSGFLDKIKEIKYNNYTIDLNRKGRMKSMSGFLRTFYGAEQRRQSIWRRFLEDGKGWSTADTARYIKRKWYNMHGIHQANDHCGCQGSDGG